MIDGQYVEVVSGVQRASVAVIMSTISIYIRIKNYTLSTLPCQEQWFGLRRYVSESPSQGTVG